MSPIVTRTRVGSSGDTSCPHCSHIVPETDDSIKCDKCGCWAHLSCTKVPKEALTFMETEGVFWFCNECTKSVKKIVKMKSYTDTEFRDEVSRSLTEVKSSIQKLEAKYQSVLPNPTDTKTDNKNVVKYPTTDTNLEIKLSGVPEYSSDSNTKFSDVMEHEFRESKKILNFLGEDENGITNIRRLGKFNKTASRPRPILVTFNNYWTVKKLLAGAFRLKNYNEEHESSIFLNRFLNKDEQEREKLCLSKRYSLIQQGYIKEKFRISNLKLFYEGREIDTTQ